MPVLVFDLETTEERSLSKAASADRDVVAPPACHRIVAIGHVHLDDDLMVTRMGARVVAPLGAIPHQIDTDTGEVLETEREVVANFLGGIIEHQPLLVGANTGSFDLPVLLARAFAFGLKFPFRHCRKDVFYKYGLDAHMDVMHVLAGFGAGARSSVHAWCRLIGFPGKVGVDGSMVAKLVDEGRWNDLAGYVLTDAIQEAALFQRTELTRGNVKLDEFRAAGSSLLEAIDADETASRVLSERIDREAFLLTRAA